MTQLLGPAEIRGLAAELDVRPTKKLGQNFVHDPNTVRRIVELAGVGPDDHVLEVGSGLGSLTLGLLAAGARVSAVEIDSALADRLPVTVADRAPEAASRLTVLAQDALRLRAADLLAPPVPSGDAAPGPPLGASPQTAVSCGDAAPTPTLGASPQTAVSCGGAAPTPPLGASPQTPFTLVANLPYNVAVPVVLHLLAELPSVRRGLVMVQAEVADRMAARPGSRVYGVPSVKLAWYGQARRVASVPRSVFWPVPNVDSALVSFERMPEISGVDRDLVFSLIDKAFSQRRKTLRAALASWAGSADRAGELLRAAGVDPGARGEQLGVKEFAQIAQRADLRPSV